MRGRRTAPGETGPGPTRGASAIRKRIAEVSQCLSWRLVLLLTSTLALLLGVSGFFVLELHRRQLAGFLETHVVLLGETILSGTHASMLRNDQEQLRQIVENVGEREDVLSLRIFDENGEIRHSNLASEIGGTGDLEAPTCQGCHSDGEPRVPATPRDGLHVYRQPGGGRTLGMVVPILNSQECATAACHVHPPERKVLGVMDLEVSTAGLDLAMARARRQLVILLLITAILAPALAGIISWRALHHPFHALLEGIRRTGRGDFGSRVSESHPGELGELAREFNAMAGRLERADRDLRRWNDTLEERVQDKTRELEQTRDRIVVAEKMASLGKLAAIVAHEINNPLAGVLVYAKLLRRRLGRESAPEDGTGGESVDAMLATIERETARCGDIVRNLLAVSRRTETDMLPVKLDEIVEQSVRLARHQADLQGIEVHTDLPRDLPPVVANGGHMRQAVTALVMNAIEAMPDGGVLTVRIAEGPGQTVILEVGDTGSGIPEELRTRIFEPFFTTKEEGMGTGLGLAVTYGIVRSHGGRIDFESRPGGGTTFRVTLPLEPPPRTEGMAIAGVGEGDVP